MRTSYDVIVIGGGTSGCAAAYIAGKLGLKTLIVEKKIHLGGAITSGLVVPVMYSGSHQINTDFYNALILEMQKVGGQVTYQNNPGWFNPELMKIVLDKMMKDANVDILLTCEVTDVEIEEKKVKSIFISSMDNDKQPKVGLKTNYVIDATGNANFCKKINCGFLEENNEFQPMSLRFVMSGIDLEKFADWIFELDKDRNVTTVEKSGGQIHFSTACTWDNDKNWALAPIFEDGVKNKELTDYDRNYFQIFTIAGMPGAVAFNCPRIVENLNPNDTLDRTKALVSARISIFRLSEFCKNHFPGFERAYISNIADELGVRVSNRVKGKYVYTIEDLKSGKVFKHPAVISNYPVDVHSSSKNSSTLNNTGEYQLSIESLMSADYDNVFVVGRCLSADYMAQGALRVQASCFAMGEAAAKYIAQHK